MERRFLRPRLRLPKRHHLKWTPRMPPAPSPSPTVPSSSAMPFPPELCSIVARCDQFLNRVAVSHNVTGIRDCDYPAANGMSLLQSRCGFRGRECRLSAVYCHVRALFYRCRSSNRTVADLSRTAEPAWPEMIYCLFFRSDCHRRGTPVLCEALFRCVHRSSSNCLFFNTLQTSVSSTFPSCRHGTARSSLAAIRRCRTST